METTKLCQQGICPCCGANSDNRYQHDPDCRCNSPEWSEATAKFWNSGRGHALVDSTISPFRLVSRFVHATAGQRTAYMQGFWCTQRKLRRESDRTLLSLEQAVDIAKGRPGKLPPDHTYSV